MCEYNFFNTAQFEPHVRLSRSARSFGSMFGGSDSYVEFVSDSVEPCKHERCGKIDLREKPGRDLVLQNLTRQPD